MRLTNLFLALTGFYVLISSTLFTLQLLGIKVDYSSGYKLRGYDIEIQEKR